jgi:Ca2+-binding RTX toxin-like protein
MAVTTYDWSEAYYGTKLNLTGYTLDFVDEFNTDTIVDGTRYDTGTAPWQNFDLATAPAGAKWFSPVHNNYGGATFGNPDSANDPFKVANGELTITMKKDASGKWTSGSMNSTDFWDQGYEINQGYFEIRAKFDRADAPGAWPAFWLISQEGNEREGWGTRIEYDILEAYSTDSDGHHTAVHVTDKKTGQSGHESNYAGLTGNGMGANMFDGQYHTYGGLIENDQIITYMDGIEIARQKIDANWDNAKFHMIVSLAMNPDEVSRASGEYHMTVDYVKTYVKGGGGSNPLPQPTPAPTPTPTSTPTSTPTQSTPAPMPAESTLKSVKIVGTSNADVLRVPAANSNTTGEANKLWGYGGNDKLYGGKGYDWLSGGLGNDVLTGGEGPDLFVFDVKPSKADADRITDFNVANDLIYLDNEYMKLGAGTKAQPAKLSSESFWIGSKAHDSTDRVIYDNKTGALYYDADGSKSGAATLIATMSKNLKLAHHDIYVI